MEHESTATGDRKVVLYYIMLQDKIREGELHKCVYSVHTRADEDILVLKSTIAESFDISEHDLKVFPMVAPYDLSAGGVDWPISSNTESVNKNLNYFAGYNFYPNKDDSSAKDRDLIKALNILPYNYEDVELEDFGHVHASLSSGITVSTYLSRIGLHLPVPGSDAFPCVYSIAFIAITDDYKQYAEEIKDRKRIWESQSLRTWLTNNYVTMTANPLVCNSSVVRAQVGKGTDRKDIVIKFVEKTANLEVPQEIKTLEYLHAKVVQGTNQVVLGANRIVELINYCELDLEIKDDPKQGYFLLMPYRGRSFLEIEETDGYLNSNLKPILKYYTLAKELMEGVAFLHEHNVVHLGLDKGNALLSSSARNVTIIDFQTSKIYNSTNMDQYGRDQKDSFKVDELRDINACGKLIFKLSVMFPPVLCEEEDGTSLEEDEWGSIIEFSRMMMYLEKTEDGNAMPKLLLSFVDKHSQWNSNYVQR